MFRKRSRGFTFSFLLIAALSLSAFQISEGDSGTVWEYVYQIALIIVALIGGGPGLVWVVQRLKKAMNLSGTAAWVLSAAASVVAAIAFNIAEGSLTPDVFEPQNTFQIFSTIWLSSQVYYGMLRDREVEATLRQMMAS